MKKSLAISFLFIGTICGAGFSSGREILTFFSANPALAPLAVVSCGLVFFISSVLLLSIARRVNISDVSSLVSHFPAKLQTAFEIGLIFCFIIVCCMMVSGANSVFGSSSPLGISGAILFLCGCGVVSFGTKGLLKANFILVPILLFFIVFVSIFHLYKSGVPTFKTENLNYVTSIFEGVSYSSMNLLLSAVILLSAGRGITKKQAIISSFISSTVISAVILLFFLAMNTSSEFLLADMPIVPMTRTVSQTFHTLSILAIWIAIFTTFSSSLSVCFEYLNKFCKPPILRFLILLAVIFPISLLGFSHIITIFMPAMGVFGIVVLLLCLKIYNTTKPKKQRRKYSPEEVIVTPLD